MANRYFVNGLSNNNWGNTANWSLTSNGTTGVSVPSVSDDVFFDSFSPNCIIDTSSRVCKSLNFTGYTRTITFSQQLTVSGDITLSPNMTILGSSNLIINANSTITTNGKMIGCPLSTSGQITLTLNDLLSVGTFSFTSGSILTFTGSYGWSASNLNIQTAGSTHSLRAGVTYSISSYFSSLYTDNSQKDLIRSDSTSQHSILILSPSATQRIAFTNFNWIDNNLGQTIYLFNGTASNCVNILNLTSQKMLLSSYTGTYIAI